MKIKNLLTLALCIAMCISAAACGKGGSGVSKVTGGDDDMDNTAYSGIEEYAGSTIKFATWVDHKEGEGAVPMASFAEKYDIEVELTAIPQGDYATKLSGMIAAGQSPDMIVDNVEFPTLLPYAEPLNNVKSIDLSDSFWDKTVTEMSTFNGNTYFVNSLNSPWTYRFMCFYNIKLFEDNGFKSPAEYYKENNWNIDTFVSCAKQIRTLGSDYVGASVRQEFAAAIFESETTRLKDGKFVNNVNDPNLSKAYKWMLQGKESGYFITTSGMNQFLKNQCGLFLYGDFGLRSTGGFQTMDPDLIGYVPLPKPTKDQSYYPSVASWRAYGICKGSKNAEATGYFIRYFLDFNNYDRDTMFKSERADKFYDELRGIEDHTFMLTYYGVNRDLANTVEVITASSSSQVDTNLKAISNRVDIQVEKANNILEKLD